MSFVQEFVIGFGFLSGFWLKIGIDPESLLIDSVLSFLRPFIDQIPFGGFYIAIFYLLPFFGVIVSIAGTFAIAGIPGIITVALAFLAGLTFSSKVGIWLLVISVLIGFFTPFFKE